MLAFEMIKHSEGINKTQKVVVCLESFPSPEMPILDVLDYTRHARDIPNTLIHQTKTSNTSEAF